MFFLKATIVLSAATVEVVGDFVSTGYSQLFLAAKKSTRVTPAKAKEGFIDSAKALLSAADQQYHDLICQKLDPLLAGPTREKFLRELMGNSERTLSTHEKHANRRLGVAVAATGLLGLMSVTGWPLVPLLLASAVYVKWPSLHLSYIALVEEKRLSIVHTWVIFNTMMWVGGHFVLGTLSGVFFALYHKVRFVTHIGARQDLIDIFGLHSRTVWVVKDGVELEMPLERVAVGDTVVLDAGQMIPIDGEVIEGSALVDQHRLTGESQAAEKKEGDNVFAASLMLAGRLRVRVEKSGSATAAAQIVKILDRTIDDYGKDLSKTMNDVEHTLWPMLVCGMAGCLVAGPEAGAAILGANYVFSMIHFKMLALLNALNVCSGQNILIKDGRSLDSLSKIDILVFDKTGTLTLVQPRVVGIHARGGHSENDVLMLAATAEHRQTHPIALSILAAARERQVEPHHSGGSHYEIGYGIKVVVDGAKVLVGSQRFMKMENIALPEDLNPEIARCQALGFSLVYVAADGELVGLIELDAALRPEAQQVVHELQASGIKVCIISGDQEAPTKRLAEKLGMDTYFANVLPAAKADLVKDLQENGRRKVGFIGDGINDAVALTKADVSISFRSATNVASDNAQIVLMNDDLKEIEMLFRVARAFDKRVSTNYRRSLNLSVVGVTTGLFLPYKYPIIQTLNISNLVIGFVSSTRPLLLEPRETRSYEATRCRPITPLEPEAVIPPMNSAAKE